MHGHREVGCIVLILMLLTTAGARASDHEVDDALAVASKTEVAFVDLAQRVEPAVVNIRRFVRDDAWWAVARTGQKTPAGWRVVSDDDLRYPGFRPDGGGSGFLITNDGYLLSLRRVVVDPATDREAEVIDIELGANHYKADVIALEPTIDLAILKIVPSASTPFLELGDSGRVRTGHWAIAFGNPTGPEKTFVPGVVAHQPTRDCYQDELSATYLQSSMRVCAGALGGPLVNLRGEAIGINTRRGDTATSDSAESQVGSGYALPINLAKAIYQSLLAKESRESPWLGVSVLLLTDDLRKKVGDPGQAGIYIDNVFDPSPASRAGIKIGDILRSMDGQPIADVYDFQRRLYLLGAGDRVKLGIVRNRKSIDLLASIEKRPPQATTR